MLNNIFVVSVSMSAVILLLLLAAPIICKRYTAKCKYFIWCFIAVRLLIPFTISLPQAPVNLPVVTNINVGEISLLKMSADSLIEEGVPSAALAVHQAGETTEAQNTAQKTKDIWLDIPLFIWLTGVAAFLIYHFVGYAIFRRNIRPWCNIIAGTRPAIAECRKISGPMLVGFIKPMILIPQAEYNENDLNAILTHETVHYKRRDLWYKLVLMLANAVHWFNPVVYLMVHFANKDLELSCDEIVIKNKDLNFRKDYSRAILNSIQTDKTTAFSTCLQGNKRDMKERLSNILNMNKRKTGILALVFVLLMTIAASTLVACNKQDSVADSDIARLFEMKDTYTGDNSGVRNIVGTLDFAGIPVDSIQLQTDNRPYRITVNYKVDSRANWRFLNYRGFEQTMAVMFALIPNVDEILCLVYDDYSEVFNPDTSFAGAYGDRMHMYERTDMEQFTDEYMKSAVSSLEAFTAYYKEVDGLKAYPDSALLAEKYALIGDDCEIVLNSAMGVDLTITEDLTARDEFKALMQEQGINPAEYIGKQLKFQVEDIRNFKTDVWGCYLYVFCEDELIAAKDLQTPLAGKNLMDGLRNYAQE